MKHTLLNIACLTCLAAVTVSIAAGSTAHLSWIAPTAYTDGSSLPASDIDHYTITWAPAAGSTGVSGSTNIPAGTVATTVNVPCGSTTFTVSVTTGPGAKYPSTTSAPTGAVPYATGIACAPNPPSGLAAQ